MNRIAFACLIIFLCSLISSRAQGTEPAVGAKAAVLIDLNDGQVLWERQSRQILPPASTTKVLTAILAYDLGNLNKICPISKKAASVGEASLHLRPGEKINLGDLLKGALLCSGNDACLAIAENIAGSEALFIHWMDLKAQILGAQNSNFINSNGLPAKNHFVTAYDLALISRYAMNNQEFASVVGTKSAVIGQDGSKRYLKNTNKLLSTYPGCIGIKTGTTVEAGQCLVAAVEKGSERYLSVVLNSPDRYGDSMRLLQYGVENFSPRNLFHRGDPVKSVTVLNGTQPYVPALIPQDITVVLPENKEDPVEKQMVIKEHILAPVKKGQSLGHVDVFGLNHRLITRVNIVAGADVPRRETIWEKATRWWHFLKIKEFTGLYRTLFRL